MDDGKTHTFILQVDIRGVACKHALTRARARVTARLLLAANSLRLICAVRFSSLAHSLVRLSFALTPFRS